MSPTLCEDIWAQVTQYISVEQLKTLYSVNLAFYNLAMRARYEQVTISQYDRHTKRFCANLREAPVATLVRSVVIQPWEVQPRVQQKCRHWTQALSTLVNRVTDASYVERRATDLKQKRVEKEAKRVISALLGLPNVAEFTIDWDEARPCDPEILRPFVALIRQYQLKLRVLSLKIPTGLLPLLAPIKFPNLEVLKISFRTGSMSRTEINHHLDPFSVFINNLYPSLEAFSITSSTSSEELDLSYLFHVLGRFPHLKTFSLSIPFDGVQLSSPSELHGFLEKHLKTLQTVRISTTRCTAPTVTPDPGARLWIHRLLSSFKNPFTDLRNVQIALRPLQEDLSLPLAFLMSHVSTLESLALTDRTLVYDDTERLVNFLTQDSNNHLVLKKLSLRVRHLTPQLLSLLCLKIPQLQELELSYHDIMAAEVQSNEADGGRAKKSLALFKNQMKRRLEFASWGLRRLAIPSATHERFREIEQIFIQCIPALQGVTTLLPLVT